MSFLAYDLLQCLSFFLPIEHHVLVDEVHLRVIN